MASTFPWGDLPIALGELLRSGVSGVVEEVIAAVRAEVPEYDQPLEGEFGMLISRGVTVALEQFVGLLGRDEDVPDLATSAGLGRAEHRAGRTLDALQSAYRVGARVAWRAMAQAGAAEGVESTTMYRLAEAGQIDLVTHPSTGVHDVVAIVSMFSVFGQRTAPPFQSSHAAGTGTAARRRRRPPDLEHRCRS